MATEGKEVNMVADDKDVLSLLMHHWIDTTADVYVQEITQEKFASMENM